MRCWEYDLKKVGNKIKFVRGESFYSWTQKIDSGNEGHYLIIRRRYWEYKKEHKNNKNLRIGDRIIKLCGWNY
jgi:hypothetical protein